MFVAFELLTIIRRLCFLSDFDSNILRLPATSILMKFLHFFIKKIIPNFAVTNFVQNTDNSLNIKSPVWGFYYIN